MTNIIQISMTLKLWAKLLHVSIDYRWYWNFNDVKYLPISVSDKSLFATPIPLW